MRRSLKSVRAGAPPSLWFLVWSDNQGRIGRGEFWLWKPEKEILAPWSCPSGKRLWVALAEYEYELLEAHRLRPSPSVASRFLEDQPRLRTLLKEAGLELPDETEESSFRQMRTQTIESRCGEY